MKLISQDLINAIERERQRQEAKFPGQKLPATAIQRVRGLDDMFSTDAKGVCACNTAGLIPEMQAKVKCDDDPDWSASSSRRSRRPSLPPVAVTPSTPARNSSRSPLWPCAGSRQSTEGSAGCEAVRQAATGR